MIRPGGAEDLEAVIAIERGVPAAPHWGVAEYAGMLPEAEGPVRRVLFVAEVAGVVKGFAVGKVVEAEGELESVAVVAAERGRGLGVALCGAVLEWCREAGARAVMLEVRVGSAGAIRLYERLGFLVVGRRRDYYGEPVEDAVVMRWVAGGAG